MKTRASDIPWIRFLPAHWPTVPLMSVLEEVKRPNKGMVEDNLLSLSFGQIVRKDIAGLDGLLPDSYETYQIVEEEDLVFRLTDLQNDKRSLRSASVRERGIITSAYTAATVTDVADARFVEYLMRAYDLTKVFYGLGGGVRQSLKFDDIRRIPVALPNLQEQRAIADYLDRETAQIDALIEKQERLITTVRERRIAALARLFEDLGGERISLRRGVVFLTSGSRGWGDYYGEEGERFLRIGNLPRESLMLRGEVQRVSLPPEVTEGTRTRIEARDLLFSITAYLGSVAVADPAWEGGYVSQHVALCRLDPRVFDSDFVGWYMLTSEGQNQLKSGADGGTKQQLALDDIRSLEVPNVALQLQKEIVLEAEGLTEAITLLIAKADRLIELSRERRAALITAAVTGQIEIAA